MKNVFYAILFIGVLIASVANPLAAQNSNENQRITITKEIRQDDGTIVTETIIKEGDAAQEFDLDDYLNESNDENVTNLNIEIGSDNDVRIERTERYKTKTKCHTKTSCRTKTACKPKGFLGVSPINDSEDRDGTVVSIVDGSAAENAGLQRGDRIIRMDEARIDNFDELSDFMKMTKPGQEIEITYERDGRTETITVPVGSRNSGINHINGDVHFDFDEDFNFNFDFNEDSRKEKEACLGVYSTRNGDRGVEGSRITDFTDASAARAAGLQEADIITAVNGLEVEGHDDLWDEIAKFKSGEVIKIDFVRNGENRSLSVGLNPCEGKTETNTWTEESHRFNQPRRINEPRQSRRIVREIIVIKKIDDASDARTDETAIPSSDGRNLNLAAYRAFPNPTDGVVNVEFQASAEPIVVSLYDLAGRQLFSEEVNSFGGNYFRQFDLSAYMTSTVVVAVVQGGKVFTEQILVKRN